MHVLVEKGWNSPTWTEGDVKRCLFSILLMKQCYSVESAFNIFALHKLLGKWYQRKWLFPTNTWNRCRHRGFCVPFLAWPFEEILQQFKGTLCWHPFAKKYHQIMLYPTLETFHQLRNLIIIVINHLECGSYCLVVHFFFIIAFDVCYLR